jgi:hypothetical protein
MPRYGGFRIGGHTVRVSRRHQSPSGGNRSRPTYVQSRSCKRCGQSYMAGTYDDHRQRCAGRTSQDCQCKVCGDYYWPGEYAIHKTSGYHTRAVKVDDP